jgi:tetratricopeptide (TPR) repeat protein
MTDAAPAPRLLLVHWEGADWALLRPLVESGLMPTLARLLGGGTLGALPPDDASPPERWRTAASGAAAAAPPLWDHLSASGHPTNVVNWPYGTPTDGVFVAPGFAYADAPGTTVRPAALADVLAPFRLAPAELSASHLLPFLPFLEDRTPSDLSPEERPPVDAVARMLAASASVHAAATWLLEHGNGEALVAHYDAFERHGAQFRRFHGASGAPPQLAQKFGGVVEGIARFYDMMLDRLLDLAGPACSTVLIGLPGATTASDASGFALFHGPPFRRGHEPSDLALADVVPTALGALGLPIPRACTGHVRAEALVADAHPTYVDAPSPSPPPGAAPGVLDAQFERARAALRRGRPEAARPILERLYDESDAPAHGMQLVLCHLRLKRPTDARRTLDRLLTVRGHRLEREGLDPDDALPAPLELLSAKVLHAEKSYAEAFESLRRAEAAAPQTALFFRRLGAVYLQLHQWADAERVFRRALAIAPRFAAAHRWLAVTLLRQGDYEEAAEAAARAAALRPRFPAAHYHRAIALKRLGRYAEAAEAAEISVAQQPTFSRARYLLTQLYRDHLDQPAKAMEHLMANPAPSPPPDASS